MNFRLRPFPRARLVGFLLLLSLLPVARATTWVLLNGDRFTGEMVSETSDSVTVEHPMLGRLTLNRSALVPTPEARAAAATAAVDARIGKVQWKHEVEFGYTQEAGANPQQNLSARVQLDGQAGADTYLLTARLTQIESGGIVAADQRALDARWRHQLSPRIFAQSLTTWSAEPVRQLDQSVEQQIGGGLRLTPVGPTTANVGLGTAVRYQERTGVAAETALLGTLFQDFTHSFASGIKFSEEASMALANDRPFSPSSGAVGAPPVPADGGNYRLRFNTLLQGKVTKQVTFNLRYDFDYDRSVPDPNGRVDRRLTTSLGYAW